MAQRAPTTSPPPTDETLAAAASRGCRSSFEQLAVRHQVALVHFLRRWVDAEQADDLAQDTLLRAWNNLHRYRPNWEFRTWLFTIARRLTLNAIRRRKPAAAVDLSSIVDTTAGPDDAMARADSRRRLWQLAAQLLNEREMTALWLYYAEDMPTGEIAQVVRRSPSAVKTMLFRARKKLQHALTAQSNQTATVGDL